MLCTTPEHEYWIIVMSSEMCYRLLSYHMSVLKENIHLTVELSIRYCEAVQT